MRIILLALILFIATPIMPAQAGENSEQKILIAYFSVTGTTLKMAQSIADSTGGTLFEIATTYDYPKEYNDLKVIVEKELKEQARPELKNKVENFDAYDIIFLGFPNWMGNMPMPLYSFIESNDLEGKTLIPFCTNKGSGFGLALQRLKTALPHTKLLQELALHGEQQNTWDDQLHTWLTGLGLKK